MSVRTRLMTFVAIAILTAPAVAGTFEKTQPADIFGKWIVEAAPWTIEAEHVACRMQLDLDAIYKLKYAGEFADASAVSDRLIENGWCFPLKKGDIVRLVAQDDKYVCIFIPGIGIEDRCLWTTTLNLNSKSKETP
jgi:hypothetical protein